MVPRLIWFISQRECLRGQVPIHSARLSTMETSKSASSPLTTGNSVLCALWTQPFTHCSQKQPAVGIFVHFAFRSSRLTYIFTLCSWRVLTLYVILMFDIIMQVCTLSICIQQAVVSMLPGCYRDNISMQPGCSAPVNTQTYREGLFSLGHSDQFKNVDEPSTGLFCTHTVPESGKSSQSLSMSPTASPIRRVNRHLCGVRTSGQEARFRTIILGSGSISCAAVVPR